MNEKKGVQEVLDAFRKTSEELARKLAEEKKNAVQIQIDNLRKEVKELKDISTDPVKPSPAGLPIP